MTTHIENLKICSYRGIENLEINDLGAVNIIVGDNNVGKTSVLEAIQLLCAPNKYNLIQVARQREKYKLRISMGLVDALRYLFKNNHANYEDLEMEISGKILGESGNVCVKGSIGTQLFGVNEFTDNSFSNEKALEQGMTQEVDTFFGKIESSFYMNEQLSFFEDRDDVFEINKYSTIRVDLSNKYVIIPTKMVLTFDHVLENSFNAITRSSKIKDKAITLLQDEFDNDIVDLRIISDSQSLRYTAVVENRNGDYIPLPVYGDGMKKMLVILNAILNAENGVVLVDEFETALHTSAMKNVFSFIMEAARKSNVQLFMTTHSIEALDKMLESAGENIDDIRVIRLKKKNGKMFSRIYNGNEALKDRMDYNLELRE